MPTSTISARVLAMDAVEALERLGGTARRARLLLLVPEWELRQAVRSGAVRRASRGRYVLPQLDDALTAASRTNGVLALLSAALHHGWKVAWPPDRPQVAFPSKRKVPVHRRRGVQSVWVRDLDTSLVATPPLDTVVACARMLDFADALCVADSALRSQMVTRDELERAGSGARGPGAAKIRRVVEHADALAANPFESMLRAITIELGLRFVVQHPVTCVLGVRHPDLADPERRILLEADSWEFHAGKRAHTEDCVRYNAFVEAGWTVLRFSWEHVMLDPEYVRKVLTTFYPRVARVEVALPATRRT